MKLLKAGAAYSCEFVTTQFSTGAAYDATGTPTATATRNGTDDGAFALTVAKIDTGRYKITGTVPAYTAGDIVCISVAATVDSVAAKGVVDEFYVVAVDLTDAAALGLSRLDAAITTRLASASYTAPDNAAITDIHTDVGTAIAQTVATAIRAALGLASANLDTQLAALPTAAENATEVWAVLPTFTVVSDGGNSSTQVKTNRTETDDDYWKDALAVITSGVLAGQVKKVAAYNGTTKVLTVTGGFTGTPAADVTGLLLNR